MSKVIKVTKKMETFPISKESIEKQWLVKQMYIPYDMTYEISSYLFYTPLQQKKKYLNIFIEQEIVRYDYEFLTKCMWGVGFLFYNAPALQNFNCLKCGNFVVQDENKFSTKNQCCLCPHEN
jgi:hypothetical protein